ncbi:MAG: SGNH/GDSL hydrolase family protein [Proteobacteria bacterium]|nr:SGNH/GDSL hydrolase family protein [Pseudomonadota bacterium]
MSLIFFGFEGVLKFLESRKPSLSEEKSSFIKTLVMRTELEHRDVQIEGSDVSYYWQGKLHVHKYEGFRRTSPFPEKLPVTLRIMIVGDSLTYGYGIDEQDTYSNLIQKALSEHYRVEVLNLGHSGYQSEDIYHLIDKYLPLLQPDLIVYGMCLNDFLSSGIGQYQNNMAYQVPFPWKEVFLKRTRTARFLSDRYNKLLMKLKLRNDFFSDILKDFKNYRVRFAQDMQMMNQLAKSKGLPPIVGMVLNQYPCINCPSYQISKYAELYMKEAGMTVIPANYIEELTGKGIQLHVNQWEGHPNEKANQIFSEMFVQEILKLPLLNQYIKD